MSKPRRIAFRVALAIVWVGALALLLPSAGEGYAPARAFELARGSGWLAALALIGALVISPLRRVRRALGRPERAWLAALRRSLGLAAASCGLAHAAFALASLPGVAESLIDAGWLRAGLGAVALLMLLFATSFDAVLRRLRLQHWTELHWLVYPTGLLVAAHSLLGPNGSPVLELAFFLSVASLLAVRVVFIRKSESKSTAD